MDKNSNSGVKVSVTLYFLMKTEMTNFRVQNKKEGTYFILTATNDSIFFSGPVSAPL